MRLQQQQQRRHRQQPKQPRAIKTNLLQLHIQFQHFPTLFPSVFHVALQFFQARFDCSFSPFFVLFSTFHYCFLFLIKFLQLLCLFICYALPCPALCHYSCLSVIHYVPDLLPALAVCSLLSLSLSPCLSPLLI